MKISLMFSFLHKSIFWLHRTSKYCQGLRVWVLCFFLCFFLFSKTCSCLPAFYESRRTTVSAKNLSCFTQEKVTYILEFAVYMNFAAEDIEVKCYCPMLYPLTSGAGMWICAALRSLIRLSHSLTVNGKQAIFTNTAIVRGQGVWLAHTLMLEC